MINSDDTGSTQIKKGPAFGKSILIVEDEEALSTALQLKLSSEGIKVTLAANGQEGLDAITKGHFDLVLMDLIMPVMDGYTVMKKLKEQGNKTKVVVLSNLSQQEDLIKAKELGALDFLVKSEIQLSKILEYIEQVLSAK